MPRLLALLAAGLLAAAPALSTSARAQDASVVPEDSPNWRPLGEAATTAKAEGDLVLVHAYAVWCGWCARFDQDVYTDDAIQAYLGEHYQVARLDIESPEAVDFFGVSMPQREIGTLFEVTGTPTTLFFDAEGTYITKLPGYAPPEVFVVALRYVREKAYEMMSFQDYIDMLASDEPGQGG